MEDRSQPGIEKPNIEKPDIEEPSLDNFPSIAQQRRRLADLLEKTPPPVFVFDPEILADRYAALRSRLDAEWPNSVIAYSYKTNYTVTDFFKEQGVWAEVVSGREYEMAKEKGYPGEEIVFNGPCKTDDELARAFEDGALINVNDHDELTRVIRRVERGKRRYSIGIRLSCAIGDLGASRFGFSLDRDEADRAAERIAETPRLDLAGIHMHLLSDTDDPRCFREAIQKMGAFLRSNVPDYRETLRYIDLGGGFPAHERKPYRKERWRLCPIREFVAAIAEELGELFPDRDAVKLILEPGRYLVADGTLFFSRTIGKKRLGSRQVLQSNATINMLGMTPYRPQIVRAFTPDLVRRSTAEVPTVIYGANCWEGDVLLNGPLAECEIGDYLVHFAAGAYHQNLCSGWIYASPAVAWL